MVVQTQRVIPPGQGLISEPPRELLLGFSSGDATKEMAGLINVFRISGWCLAPMKGSKF